MKKQFTAIIAIVLIVALCCGFAFSANTISSPKDSDVEYIVRTVEVEVDKDEFCVKRLDYFYDPNLYNYSLNELKPLIEQQYAIQDKAHALAELARELGWPEDSAPIKSAQAEWWNADAAVKTYEARYEKLWQDKWGTKIEVYPYATEIWLFMKDLGWNDYVCAGIMGNLMAEVGGQTLNIQYWLYGDNYYGMCQWNKGYKSQIWGADLATQCEFLRDTIEYELDTFGFVYAKGFNFDSFLELSNERDAALAFAKCYERCASDYYSIRQTNAEKAYDYFVNN